MYHYQFSETEYLQQIAHNSPQFIDAVALRYQVLRKPLNLDFTQNQLDAEKDYVHLNYYHHNVLVACLQLVKQNSSKLKMRQVAVAEAIQGKGYGYKFLMAVEKYAIHEQYQLIHCNARVTAVQFYLKANYRIIGDQFLEVGIPHVYMEKFL